MGAAFHLATKYELLKENGGIYSLEEYFSHTLGMIAQRTVANLLPLEVMNQLDNVSRFMIEVLMTMSSGEVHSRWRLTTLLNDHDIEEELIVQYIDQTDEEVRLNHGVIADPMYAHGPLPIQDGQLSFRTEMQATLFGDWSKAPNSVLGNSKRLRMNTMSEPHQPVQCLRPCSQLHGPILTQEQPN